MYCLIVVNAFAMTTIISKKVRCNLFLVRILAREFERFNFSRMVQILAVREFELKKIVQILARELELFQDFITKNFSIIATLNLVQILVSGF